MMKDVFLVGESVPLKDDGSNYRVTPCGQLDRQLEDFDPRHGVFCNFVATPLLATVTALTASKSDALPFINQFEQILGDKSDRRFNLFKEKKKEPNEPFVIRDDLPQRVAVFDSAKHLWLLTGYQTAFGLLAWLLDDRQTSVWQRSRIEEVAFAFLTAASTHERLVAGWPTPVEIEPKTGHTALLHRLCVEDVGQEMLAKAVHAMAKTNVSHERIIGLLRYAVPLLHNEAYRQGNIGNVQGCFVRYATGKIKFKPNEQYWHLMGSAIAVRLQDEFIKR